MNALDAAAKVLQGAGGPLHYREITRRILSSGRWAQTSSHDQHTDLP